MKRNLLLVVFMIATLIEPVMGQRKIATDKLQLTRIKNAAALGTDNNGNVIEKQALSVGGKFKFNDCSAGLLPIVSKKIIYNEYLNLYSYVIDFTVKDQAPKVKFKNIKLYVDVHTPFSFYPAEEVDINNYTAEGHIKNRDNKITLNKGLHDVTDYYLESLKLINGKPNYEDDEAVDIYFMMYTDSNEVDATFYLKDISKCTEVSTSVLNLASDVNLLKQLDPSSFVPYNGAAKPLNLGSQPISVCTKSGSRKDSIFIGRIADYNALVIKSYPRDFSNYSNISYETKPKEEVTLSVGGLNMYNLKKNASNASLNLNLSKLEFKGHEGVVGKGDITTTYTVNKITVDAKNVDVSNNQSNSSKLELILFDRDKTHRSTFEFPDIQGTHTILTTSTLYEVLQQQGVKKLKFKPVSGIPISEEKKGLVIFNKNTNKLQCYDGSEWHDLW